MTNKNLGWMLLLWLLLLALAAPASTQVYTETGGASASGLRGGVICTTYADATNTNAAETVMATCTVPANTLTASGHALVFRTQGITAANVNVKNIKVRFGGIGGTIVAEFNGISASAAPWRLEGEIIRTGATTQRSAGVGFASTSAFLLTSAAPTQTLSGAVDLVVTGLGVATADVTLKTLVVEVAPYR